MNARFLLKRLIVPTLFSNNVSEKLRTTQSIYDEAVRLQQSLDELLERATTAYNIALEAKSKADGILTQTKETLRILQNFDDEVQQSKNLALEALQQIPEIERLIIEAEGKTRGGRPISRLTTEISFFSNCKL